MEKQPDDGTALLTEPEDLRAKFAALETAARQLQATTEAYRESEERYRTLFEKTTNPIWVIDGEGNYIACNDAAAAYSCLTRQELLSKNVRDFLPPGSGPELLDMYRAVWVTGGTLEIDFPVQGQIKRLELTITPARWRGKAVIFGVGRDVTEQRLAEQTLRKAHDELERRVAERTAELTETVRKLEQEVEERNRAEEALRESEERFRAEYKAIPVPTYTFRRIGDDFTLLDFNAAAETLTRGKIRDIVGITVGKLYADAPGIREDFARCFAERGVIHKEMPYRLRTTGEELYVMVTYVFVPPDLVMVHTMDLTERVRAEEKVKREQRLLRQLLAMQERERKLIAYEIHDGFVQHVTGAKMLLESFRSAAVNAPAGAWKLFDAGLDSLEQGIVEARRLISGLRPPVLDDAGLTAAIKVLIHDLQQHGGPPIEFINTLDGTRLAPVLENAIFRIIQECLTNACRYSQTAKIRVKLQLSNTRVHLEVRDWGVGFDPKEVPAGHYGLRGIRERARLLGGRVAIGSKPGKGTRIRVDLPRIRTFHS